MGVRESMIRAASLKPPISFRRLCITTSSGTAVDCLLKFGLVPSPAVLSPKRKLRCCLRRPLDRAGLPLALVVEVDRRG